MKSSTKALICLLLLAGCAASSLPSPAAIRHSISARIESTLNGIYDQSGIGKVLREAERASS